MKCEGYVTLSLYFQLLLGLVRLQNVEAYVLKGLTIPLLIGEDIQTPWDLSMIRQDGTIYWQVGESDHRIPLRNQQNHHQVFLTSRQLPTKPKVRPLGTGRLRTIRDETLATGCAKLVTVSGAYNENTGTCWVEMVAPYESEEAYQVGPSCLVETRYPIRLLLLNLLPYPVRVPKGTLIGHMYDPWCHLQLAKGIPDEELTTFWSDVMQLHTLFSQTPLVGNTKEEELSLESDSWGPKTAELPPGEPIEPEALEDILDINTSLSNHQRA